MVARVIAQGQFYSLVVRPGAPEMRSAVDRPGEVQTGHVAEDTLVHEGVVPRLAPEVDGDHSGQQEAEEYLQQDEMLLMETHHGIGQYVTHIDLSTTTQHIRMLQHHQPANVREEEASICIVRIGVCFRILMMHTMIAYPIVQGVLRREREGNGKRERD